MVTQTINHIGGCRSLQNSLTQNAKLRQSLAHHPNTNRLLSGICLNDAHPNCSSVTTGDTTAASGCTIILLGDVLSAHNLVGDGDLLDWVQVSGNSSLINSNPELIKGKWRHVKSENSKLPWG